MDQDITGYAFEALGPTTQMALSFRPLVQTKRKCDDVKP